MLISCFRDNWSKIGFKAHRRVSAFSMAAPGEPARTWMTRQKNGKELPKD